MLIPESRNTSKQIEMRWAVHNGLGFPRGIYSKIHSPITTPEIISVIQLALNQSEAFPNIPGKREQD